MKKNYNKLWIVSAFLLAAASCSQEENVAPSSQEVTTFRITLDENGVQSRSGEGSEITNLYYEVYQGSANRTKVLDNYGDDANAEPVTVENGIAIVEMPILRGEYYDIIFWAQADLENSIYDPTDLENIEVDYSKAYANKEAYDAFFYGKKGFQATTNETTIELRRPFGQLNIGTTYNEDENNPGDWQKAIAMTDNTYLPVTSSEIKVKGLANRFNALTHVASVDGELGEVTYKLADLIAEQFKVKNDNVETQYQSLGMNYLLVSSSETETEEYIHKDNVEITATFNRGNKELFSFNLPNVPVQRNWRTNVIGELLAADKTFQVVIVPGFDDDEIYPDTPEEEVYMKAATGGVVTLTEDVTLTGNFYVQSDMVINLNGHTLNYTGSDAIMARVVDGATLTINGDNGSRSATGGRITSTGYIASARENSTVIVNSGTFFTTSCTLFQADGGKVYIKGGHFSNDNQTYGTTYLLNHIDSKKEIGLIEVTGGTFVGYNPNESASENPVMSFLPANGEYEAYEKDGQWQVMTQVVSFVDMGEYAEVYTAEGLLKWAYIVNKTADKNGYGLKLMRDIEMPAFTIEEDAANETYVFTETPITVDENGVPSGSNWVPVRNNADSNGKYYEGIIDGSNNVISGLRLNYDNYTAGFIGYNNGGKIQNLILNNAYVYSDKAYTGILVGYNENNSLIENCHVTDSKVKGNIMVGAIVGCNWTKVITDAYATVLNCSVDNMTTIEGIGTSAGNGGSLRGVGGIAGQNWGGIISSCFNSGTVKGKVYVGGIVGSSRNNDNHMSGYVIGCHNNGNVIAETSNAGGIAGENLKVSDDNGSVIVGCYSTSADVNTPTKLLVGTDTERIFSSWAISVGSIKSGAKSESVYVFDTFDSITENIVASMNEAIADFNKSNAEQVQCPYTWSWTSGSWPTLVKSSNE